MKLGEEVLRFQKHVIRIALFSGVPWFALPDICDALDWDPQSLENRVKSLLPSFAWKSWVEAEDVDVPGRPEHVTLLSPIGVWYLTHLGDPAQGQSIAAWAKREAESLCPHSCKDDPTVNLTLLPGGHLPPYPLRYSGRKAEWYNLANSKQESEARNGFRFYAQGLQKAA